MEFEVVAEKPFFAPVASDLIDQLLGQYASMRRRIEVVAELVTGETAGAVRYFIEGNANERQHHLPPVEKIFETKGAIAALNAGYWSKTMALTDVYDAMPQARRDEWNKSIREKATPDFEEETVRATIGELLNSRAKFFAERVDGIFRSLSGDHVTNVPQGFGKRMILGYMLSYGGISHTRAGLINDLRCVVAKFMGRDDPKHNSSSVLLTELYKCTGQWVAVDGGALRIRVYKKGTAHIEVHPDMAWRLNQILASLHPLAIPAQFRAKPPKQAKAFQLMGRPLPFATLELLSAGLQSRRRTDKPAHFSFGYAAKEHKHSYADARAVLESLGGTPDGHDGYEFDYPVEEVLREVIVTGCLPDQKAHQFYPTPEKLARIAVELADIGPDHQCLEPSAGQGGISDHLPKDRTLCVEVSALHCAVLRAKGYATRQADFIELSGVSDARFDRVVMNPPFSDGRALAHITAAAALLRADGRLVAILPASMRGTKPLPSFEHQWSSIYEGEFAGTSVAVVILTANRSRT